MFTYAACAIMGLEEGYTPDEGLVVLKYESFIAAGQKLLVLEAKLAKLTEEAGSKVLSISEYQVLQAQLGHYATVVLEFELKITIAVKDLEEKEATMAHLTEKLAKTVKSKTIPAPAIENTHDG